MSLLTPRYFEGIILGIAPASTYFFSGGSVIKFSISDQYEKIFWYEADSTKDICNLKIMTEKLFLLKGDQAFKITVYKYTLLHFVSNLSDWYQFCFSISDWSILAYD